MQIKIISVPAMGGDANNEELNAFLRGKKVLHIEQQAMNDPGGAYWSFCIRYTEQEGRSGAYSRERKDYKQILSEEAFARFAQLREIRLKVAKDDKVPPYVVFTDEELAGLANLPELTEESMKTVKGIGDKKVEKYGAHFINVPKGPDDAPGE